MGELDLIIPWAAMVANCCIWVIFWKGNDVASFTLYYAYRIYKDFQNKSSNLSTHLFGLETF